MLAIIDFFKTFFSSSDLFLQGLWLTVQLTAASLIIAFFIGLLFALFKISNIKILDGIADVYIWVVRGTPLIVQIFVLFYGLYEIVELNAFWAGTAGLAFHNGAYIAEIIRGSIQSIDKGQHEAGRSLGMKRGLMMRRIVLPQAFRRAIPSLGNQFIIGLKDSSLVSFIGMQELFGVSNTQGSNNYDFLTYYLIVAIYYLVIVLILTLIVRKVERKLAESD
ncbi:amino acid ABC transporter permease [Aquibacillus sp. 3ASR75-11]|uniref:Amino acid ABC transporter permease n=1 Tax=Terrihalobacillus insolitus TaxID=2950438 RepID=A0A9X3WNW7_9BACI|nr:amino acid ABC transporter permease [Terrihalobacillus insolitus]MDC3412080.1 amino acid ABC transporter permease [Terrihalobacillus insolitus]MDC3423227.1 amino acid ABC transporter permease [Terrihalobacillus insolitus]